MPFADTDDMQEEEEEMEVVKKMRRVSGPDSGTKVKRKGRVLIEVTWNSYHPIWIIEKNHAL